MQRTVAVVASAVLLAAVALTGPATDGNSVGNADAKGDAVPGASAAPSAQPSAAPPGMLTNIFEGIRSATWDAAIWLWGSAGPREPTAQQATMMQYWEAMGLDPQATMMEHFQAIGKTPPLWLTEAPSAQPSAAPSAQPSAAP